MEAAAPIPRDPQSAIEAGLHRRLRTGYFTLEALNAFASSFYFNYLFFYTRDYFGFGNRNNLLLTSLYGFCYTFSCWNAGRFAQKHGYIFSLRLGFSGLALTMVLGGLAPLMLGYTSRCVVAQTVIMVLWTLSLCFTWPTLQALLSQQVASSALPRTAGIYNVVWASVTALSYLIGGALLEKFGGEIIFWLPAGLHVIQLVLLARLQKINTVVPPVAEVSEGMVPPPHPGVGPRARTFLYLAWLANPFAYIAIYGILPVIPKLAEHLGLSHTQAGLVCSIWFWVRLAAFVGCWLWTGWHYRFGWLLAAFIALAISFTAILLSPNLALLIVAQVVFGLAVGLIYYSSLFYSMDVGESRGKGGGIHEAAIGLGTFFGPAVGVAALHFLPGQANAGTWAIGSVLILGLVPFLMIRSRGRNSGAT